MSEMYPNTQKIYYCPKKTCKCLLNQKHLKISSNVQKYFCKILAFGAGDQRTKCGSCEQLVDGVNRVLKETFKQNFGGGNTHWEEAKLKKKNINWVSSESRLLEVLENACGGGYGSINLNSMGKF